MKSINLTKEQKEKLLKMCNALFPEYDSIYYIKNQRLQFIEKDNIPDELATEIFFDSSFNPKIYKIHWFEFCHEYLVEKILGDYNLIFCKKGTHPVDYLYEQFLRLKIMKKKKIKTDVLAHTILSIVYM